MGGGAPSEASAGTLCVPRTASEGLLPLIGPTRQGSPQASGLRAHVREEQHVPD